MSLPGITQTSPTALLLGAPTALGAALTAPPRKDVGKAPRYGLTMWFQVTVDPQVKGVRKADLGRWSGCSGLGVGLEVDEVWAGGDHDAPYLVPKRITHGRITLQRAMERADSAALRAWLAGIAEEWTNGRNGGAGLVDGDPASHLGATVVITLFSALGTGSGEVNRVAEWTLEHAIPVAWTGPTLSSKGGDVATETLQLAHRGFLGAQAGARARFTIHEEDAPTRRLEFQYHPDKISVEKTLQVAGDTTFQMGNDRSQMTEPNKLNLSINQLHVEGVQRVLDTYQQLAGWMAAEGSGSPEPAKRLIIALGERDSPLNPPPVRLRSMKMDYTRFTSAGAPSRAIVTLSVVAVRETEGTDKQAPGVAAAGGAGATPRVGRSASTPPPTARGGGSASRQTGGSPRTAKAHDQWRPDPTAVAP